MKFLEFVNSLNEYREERGWVNQDSADLVKSMIIEAAELLEHYQWDNTSRKTPKKDLDEIGSEVADVFIYLVAFCQENNLDLLDISEKKLEHNRKKYPAKAMKEGSSDEYYKAKEEYRKNR